MTHGRMFHVNAKNIERLLRTHSVKFYGSIRTLSVLCDTDLVDKWHLVHNVLDNCHQLKGYVLFFKISRHSFGQHTDQFSNWSALQEQLTVLANLQRSNEDSIDVHLHLAVDESEELCLWQAEPYLRELQQTRASICRLSLQYAEISEAAFATIATLKGLRGLCLEQCKLPRVSSLRPSTYFPELVMLRYSHSRYFWDGASMMETTCAEFWRLVNMLADVIIDLWVSDLDEDTEAEEVLHHLDTTNGGQKENLQVVLPKVWTLRSDMASLPCLRRQLRPFPRVDVLSISSTCKIGLSKLYSMLQQPDEPLTKITWLELGSVEDMPVRRLNEGLRQLRTILPNAIIGARRLTTEMKHLKSISSTVLPIVRDLIVLWNDSEACVPVPDGAKFDCPWLMNLTVIADVELRSEQLRALIDVFHAPKLVRWPRLIVRQRPKESWR